MGRRPFLTLFGFAALLLFAQANQPASLDVDSLNFAASAKQVFRTGIWLRWFSPIHGWPFADHPPGCVWVMALMFHFFGVSIFTAKFFSLICGLGIVLLTYWFGKRVGDRWTGFFAGLAILATNHFLRVAHQARFDCPMIFFMMLALACLVLAVERSRWFFVGFGLATSLAIMAKGLPALALLGLSLATLLLAGPRRLLWHPLYWLGVALAFSLPALWGWLEWRHYGSTTWEAYWRQQILFSAVGERGGPAQPWYHYLELLVTKQWYLVPFYLSGLWLLWKNGDGSIFEGGDRSKNRTVPIFRVLLTIWPLAILIPFSFGHFKLHHYLLPMYPALAVMAGLALNRLFAIRWKQQLARLLPWVTVAGFIVTACLPIQFHKTRFKLQYELAPFIDQIAQARHITTLLVYHQDASSLAFYTKELQQVREVREQERLEEWLGGHQPVLCFLGRAAWETLSPTTYTRTAIVLDLPQHLLIIND